MKDHWPKWAYMHRTMSVPDIARLEGCGPGTVRYVMMRLGIYRPAKRGQKKGCLCVAPNPLRKITHQQEQALIHEIAARKWATLQECATNYGITRERVRQIIRAAGLDGYELRLTDDEKRERVEEKRRAREAPKDARRLRLYENALRIAELWNDPTLRDRGGVSPTARGHEDLAEYHCSTAARVPRNAGETPQDRQSAQGMKVVEWVEFAGAQPHLGAGFSVATPRSRRSAVVLATKPGWVMVRYWL